MPKSEKKTIGSILLAQKLINSKQLRYALKLQEKHGSRLGEVLVGEGYINHLKLYQALARHYKLPYANLVEGPVEGHLLNNDERHDYSALRFMPLKEDKDGTIVLATSEPSEALHAWALKRYKAYRLVITSPFDIANALQKYFSLYDDEQARNALWHERPAESARHLFSFPSVFTICAVIGLMALVVLYPAYAIITVFLCMNIFYAASLVFKLTIFAVGDGNRKCQYHFDDSDLEVIDDASLPVYSLLIPLFKEEEKTISKLVQSIRDLDYPKSKLDVKLIVEECDPDTLKVIKELRCESYFEIIRVPFSYPQTKPKACNYALKFVRGEYVAIYDAEDIPDPYQLKKVIRTFALAPQGTVCVQAKLNYWNRTENLLTRLFAIEYSAWFNFMLLGLEKLGIPIPLGGTSNHFPVGVIRELYAWDPYNVTEDADLGIRLAQRGYKTVIVDSLTMEESPW